MELIDNISRLFEDDLTQTPRPGRNSRLRARASPCTPTRRSRRGLCRLSSSTSSSHRAPSAPTESLVGYRVTDDFRPLFEHSVERALSALAKGLGDGQGGAPSCLVPCEYPAPMNRPAIEVLAAVTRAISGQRVLSISDVSSTSGATEREIVPLALADNGLCWHVRAFDRRSPSIRDFVLTRVRSVRFLPDAPLPEESFANDLQWSREVEMELVPHPALPCPELASLDYPMTDGVRRIRAKAALAGYVLRRWSVDCSEAHSLRGTGYRRWLRNRAALERADSASIAPGYLPKDAGRG